MLADPRTVLEPTGMSSQQHWQQVYTTKATDSVSWFQPQATVSLRLIRDTGASRSSAIIDVGGGASTLVDGLLVDGYSNITVLDLSAAALAAAHTRLGAAGNAVQWIEADATRAALPADTYAVWHDRAAFHFLVDADDRRAYVHNVRQALKSGGHLIVATFAEDGPTKCSGLPICRYDAAALAAEFGEGFTLLHQEKEAHRTPMGHVQSFNYCVFRKVPA
jgi:SAM-dependent methyltransferase